MNSKYWSATARRLTPYVPGEQPKLANLVKLNTNENPYPPSPRVLAAMQAEMGTDGATLRLYPDPSATQLRQVIAQYHQLQAEQIFVGNGSDEVLAHAFLALLKQDRPLLFPDITYSFYPVYCGLYGIEYTPIALAADYAIEVAAYPSDNGGIILPNPNAPTGRLLARSDIEQLLQRNRESVVVVDEAYIDFAGPDASMLPLIDQYPNLLVVHTLSKSRSLAGLRVGFAAGHVDLIEALHRVKDSFNSYPLDRLALAGAVAAYQDQAWFEQNCQAVMRSREQLDQGLQALGFEVLPSAANFIFVRHPAHEAAQLAAALRAQGIIVRHFKQPRIEQFLRITIGTDQQCALLLDALRKILTPTAPSPSLA
ncbi:MAG: histidinol-phosphate transaminase [Sterolibacterium sp.]|nr:histidinol-phosphate transaminase [Sterolibacterium sp.]